MYPPNNGPQGYNAGYNQQQQGGYQYQQQQGGYNPQQGGQGPYGQAYGDFANPAAYQAAAIHSAKPGQSQHAFAQGGLPPPSQGYGGGSNAQLSDDMPLSIRHGFIRKVYSILSVQLLFTAAVSAGFIFNDAARTFIRANGWIFWVCFAVTFATLIAMSCFQSFARKFPNNYILLTIFTVAEGILVGISTIRYNADAIGLAAALTCGVFIACTIFAIQTKIDFTKMGGYLFVAVIALLLFGIVAAFFPRIPILQKVYAGLGCLIFSLYLVYDTQKIVGGKHRSCQMGLDDYVFSALMLYIDIINIFMFILRLVGND